MESSGDFNSDYEEYIKFKRKRRHNNSGGKTGINHVLKTINNNKSRFYNLWYDTKISEKWTYIFRGKKEALDNIIISKSLLNRENIYYKESTISSFKPSYLLKGKSIYRWETSRKKPKRHKGKGYSDHLAVIAKFIIKRSTKKD